MSDDPFIEKTPRAEAIAHDARSIFREDEEDKPKENLTDAEKRVDAWRIIFKSMESHDEHMIEGWKSEMDNLLIFAALYSAVVTAFIIESYKLVDAFPAADSPGDSSSSGSSSGSGSGGTAAMLQEISARVASYSILNGFANSTHLLDSSSSSSDHEEDPLNPPSFAIKLNKLWFVSLTISILAAFFAIAIQQWLRHLRIPKHIPLRDAVRLRQLRYQGLMRWQAPAIISILPALLQISVVLFLAGLYQWVHHFDDSDHGVSIPFTVVSATSLALFVIISFMPLIEPSCPYKSPLVHIGWELAWIGGVISALAFTLPVVAILDCVTTKKHTRLSRYANNINKFTAKYLLGLQPPTTETSHFWTSRETAAASKRKEQLDQNSLAWALTAGPRVSQLRCCLDDLPVSLRTRTVLEWISLKLEGQTDLSRMLSEGVVSERALAKVDAHFVSEYGVLLMDVLSQGWDDPKEYENDEQKDLDSSFRHLDIDIPHILMFLWQVAKFNGELKYGQEPDKQENIRAVLVKQLGDICREQRLDLKYDKSWLGWKPVVRVPSVLLCDLLLDKNPYKDLFTSEDPLSFVLWTNQRVVSMVFSGDQSATDAKMFWYAPAEHTFTSTAVTLAILLQNASKMHGKNSGPLEALRELFTKLTAFVETGKERIREIIDDEKAVRDSDLPFMTPRAIESIADSLKRLGEAMILPMDSACPSRAFAENLLEICAEKAAGEHPEVVRDDQVITRRHLSIARSSLHNFLGNPEKPSHTRSETMKSEVPESTIPALAKSGSSSSKEDDEGSK